MALYGTVPPIEDPGIPIDNGVMLPPPKLPLRPLRIIGEHKNVGASAKKVVFNVNSHPD